MIDFRVLKYFFFICLAIGLFLGGCLLLKREGDLKKSKIAYCIDHRNNERPSIIALRNEEHIGLYQEWINTQAKTVQFKFKVLEEGTEVKILDIINNDIAKIIVVNEDPTIIDPYYREYFIWRKFLSNESPVLGSALYQTW